MNDFTMGLGCGIVFASSIALLIYLKNRDDIGKVKVSTIKIAADELYCIRNLKGEYYRGSTVLKFTRFPKIFGIAQLPRQYLEDIVQEEGLLTDWYIEKYNKK